MGASQRGRTEETGREEPPSGGRVRDGTAARSPLPAPSRTLTVSSCSRSAADRSHVVCQRLPCGPPGGPPSVPRRVPLGLCPGLLTLAHPLPGAWPPLFLLTEAQPSPGPALVSLSPATLHRAGRPPALCLLWDVLRTSVSLLPSAEASSGTPRPQTGHARPFRGGPKRSSGVLGDSLAADAFPASGPGQGWGLWGMDG